MRRFGHSATTSDHAATRTRDLRSPRRAPKGLYGADLDRWVTCTRRGDRNVFETSTPSTTSPSWPVAGSTASSRTVGTPGPRRCEAWPAPSSDGAARSWPGTTTGASNSPTEGLILHHQEGQARRGGISEVRQLQAPDTPRRRRLQLVAPRPRTPLKRDGPHNQAVRRTGSTHTCPSNPAHTKHTSQSQQTLTSPEGSGAQDTAGSRGTSASTNWKSRAVAVDQGHFDLTTSERHCMFGLSVARRRPCPARA
jgi:hypothetical protein